MSEYVKAFFPTRIIEKIKEIEKHISELETTKQNHLSKISKYERLISKPNTEINYIKKLKVKKRVLNNLEKQINYWRDRLLEKRIDFDVERALERKNYIKILNS